MTWATEFYDKAFADLFLENHPATSEEMEFIKNKVGLKTGMKVLDQGCGIGRLSVELSDIGFNVTGIDIVKDYIKTAQTRQPKSTFICADAETYIAPQEFDVVINWWTSFGYGATKDNDLNVLKATFKSLKPSGAYILEIPNAKYCHNTYSTAETLKHEQVIDGVKLSWEGWLSKDKKKIIKKWSYDTPDGQHASKTGGGIWLYNARDIKTRLENCGFQNIEFFGDTKSSPLTPDSKRCIVIARKPASSLNLLPSLPKDSKEFRTSIYKGDIYKLSPTKVSLALVEALQDRLFKIFGEKALYLQNLGDHEDSLTKLEPFKMDLKHDPEYSIILKAILTELGLKPSEYAIDYIRLRVNIPGGYKNKKATPAYAAHRDTWYCNPQAQINFWVPLYDCSAQQSFTFYTDYFGRAVDNNSKDFDYKKWIEGGHATTLSPLSNPQNFACRAGEIMVFSAAHLHQGLPHDEETVRYSIDFRIVHIMDFEDDIGAPNVDNKSRPYAMADYMGSGI